MTVFGGDGSHVDGWIDAFTGFALLSTACIFDSICVRIHIMFMFVLMYHVRGRELSCARVACAGVLALGVRRPSCLAASGRASSSRCRWPALRCAQSALGTCTWASVSWSARGKTAMRLVLACDVVAAYAVPCPCDKMPCVALFRPSSGVVLGAGNFFPFFYFSVAPKGAETAAAGRWPGPPLSKKRRQNARYSGTRQTASPSATGDLVTWLMGDLVTWVIWPHGSWREKGRSITDVCRHFGEGGGTVVR